MALKCSQNLYHSFEGAGQPACKLTDWYSLGIHVRDDPNISSKHGAVSWSAFAVAYFRASLSTDA